jgi:DNA-binding PadR family transcriptional regulator
MIDQGVGIERARKSCEELRRSSPTKAAVLCLLLQQSAGRHGYDLRNQLVRRFGPGCDIYPKTLYRMLEALEKSGLVSSDRSENPDSDRIMYVATPAAEPVVEEWMGSIGSRLMLEELSAKLVVAQPDDLPRLLVAVDECERRCFAARREIAVDLPSRQSHLGALMYMAREERILACTTSLMWLDQVRGVIHDLMRRSPA